MRYHCAEGLALQCFSKSLHDLWALGLWSVISCITLLHLFLSDSTLIGEPHPSCCKKSPNVLYGVFFEQTCARNNVQLCLKVPSEGLVRSTVKSCNLIGPLYNLQTFKLMYTDITRMRGACWMVPLILCQEYTFLPTYQIIT